MAKSPVYNIDFFNPELSLIIDPDIRRLTKVVLEEMPAYIWYAPSSVTGKYHPPEDNEPGGVCLHLKKTSWVAYRIFDNLGLNTDIGVSAGLTHDISLRGLNDEPSEEYEEYEQHGELAYQRLNEYMVQLIGAPAQVVTDWYTICDCVRSHMGRWGKEKPTSPEEIALHCADVAASTRGLAGTPFIMEYLERVGYGRPLDMPDMSIEEIVSRRQYFILDSTSELVFNFGKKHEGKRLSEVAIKDKSYLRWMLNQGDLRMVDGKSTGFPKYVQVEIRGAIQKATQRKAESDLFNWGDK